MIKGRFGKFLIVATLSVVLVLSFGMQNAKAESLLFPYYKSDGTNGVYSFLTLVDTSGDVTLRYIWNYDDLSTAAKECIHEEANGISTPFDLIQQTVVDPGLSGINLPAAFSDASTAAYSLASPSEGFLIVESSPSTEGDFYGQIILVDASTGLVSAYKGLNNPMSVAPGDFSHISTSHTSYLMSNYPVSVTTTEWFVLVTGNGMDNAAGWGGGLTLTNGFGLVYNRDEDPRSGLLTEDVTCFERISRSDIMTTAQVTHTDNGGLWWELTNVNLNNGATGALMTKIESSSALGSPIQTISSENAFFNDPY
ncbi:MAG: hypothetical protein L0956_07460 [Candidatus Mariimomonas ferrooxydans]